jgi:hypothetical protein
MYEQVLHGGFGKTSNTPPVGSIFALNTLSKQAISAHAT